MEEMSNFFGLRSGIKLRTFNVLNFKKYIFAKHGFHCVGCAAASFETIAQGAIAHGIDTEKLIEDLNRVTNQKA